MAGLSLRRSWLRLSPCAIWPLASPGPRPPPPIRQLRRRGGAARIHRHPVKERAKQVAAQHLNRKSPFPQRQAQQRQRLGLPLSPPPPSAPSRRPRGAGGPGRSGRRAKISDADYEKFLRGGDARMRALPGGIGPRRAGAWRVRAQRHGGVFRRAARRLRLHRNGWVQSYGSRCVKPPIIFGDVARPKPMTVEWSPTRSR